MQIENPADTGDAPPIAPPIAPLDVRDDGLSSAVREQLGRVARSSGSYVPADQLPLLPVEPLEEETPDDPPRERGRGGRPRGSRNRSTEAWREYLGARYRSPLEVLAEIYSRPAHVLAAEVGCTRFEALQLQLRAAAESAPYWHSRQPQAVRVDGAGLVQLVIEQPHAPAFPPASEIEGVVLEAQIVEEGNQ